MKTGKIKNLIAAMLFVAAFQGCKGPGLEEELYKKLSSANSIHYKAVEKAYYSNEPDTTVTPFEVWAVRDEQDKVKKGYVWIDNNYRPYHEIYEQGNFYLAIPPKHTTILYNDFNEPFITETDWIDFFLNPELFKTLLNSKENKKRMVDTVYNGKKVVMIELNLKGNKSYRFILDGKTLTPLWSQLKIERKGSTYFDEMTFADFETDKVDRTALKKRQEKVFQENPVEKGPDSELSRMEKMLHPGDKAPLFKAKFYKDNKPFELKDYIGKNVIVIDFWYTHCHPCVKAMPSLNKLYLENQDRGLKVFGLNSVDNQPRGMAYLNSFLTKRDIHYDIILTTPDVDLMYKIQGYPTMYVIDKDGKIAYVEIGFWKERFEKLTKVVENLLSNQ
jgi:peroxiredoxin